MTLLYGSSIHRTPDTPWLVAAGEMAQQPDVGGRAPLQEHRRRKSPRLTKNSNCAPSESRSGTKCAFRFAQRCGIATAARSKMGGTGLEPVTPSLSTRPERARPFAPV